MTTYNDLLEKVKAENPELPYKEQQKKASELHKNLTAAQSSIAPPSTIPSSEHGAEEKPTGTIDRQTLLSTEARIREVGVDMNCILRHGRVIMPEGVIVKNGASGINTLVSFEDNNGNRLPVTGNFIVWI